jgi:signal transduction histidine kinase
MTEIAHDMRSPLAAILLLVEPMRRGQRGPVTPVQERQLGLIYGAALSLSALANDIIEAARGDCTAPAARPFSVRATLDDAWALVRPIAEEKHLEVHATYPGHDARIGDAAALHRVILNLVTNALKYTDSGSVAIECAELNDTDIEFTVHDTGDGIPAHALDALSDSIRTSPAAYRYSSSGLGLAICKALLEKMGSTMRIETQPSGRGTRVTFRLVLPRAPGDR